MATLFNRSAVRKGGSNRGCPFQVGKIACVLTLNLRPIRRFTPYKVSKGFITACCFRVEHTICTVCTHFGSDSICVVPVVWQGFQQDAPHFQVCLLKIDGVVRAPSSFSRMRGILPSMTATQELVVPRSMPITSPSQLAKTASKLMSPGQASGRVSGQSPSRRGNIVPRLGNSR